MSVGAADVHDALQAVWNDAEALEGGYTSLWDSSVTVSEWFALHDGEAPPNQPWPYCVYEMTDPEAVTRMSASGLFIREIRDVPLEFRVHARQTATQSAKAVAKDRVANIMQIFGGHPTIHPTKLALSNGNFLIAIYQNDFGVRTGDQEYRWHVNYTLRLDVPVAV